MNTRPFRTLHSLCYAGIAALFVAVILSAFLLQHIRVTQSKLGERLLHSIDRIAIESAQAMTTLNANSMNDCSDEHLRFMRQVLFDTKTIKEVGFYRDNQLICTTNIGLLDQPQPLDTPDYYGLDGGAVYTERQLTLFESPRTGFWHVLNNYHLILDTSILSDEDLTPSQWEVVNTSSSKKSHVLGQNGVYLKTRAQTDSLISVQFSGCADIAPHYCVAIWTDGKILFQRHIELVIPVLLISYIFGSYVYIVHRNFLRERRSLPYRIKKGLKHGHFYWLYQPIVTMESQQVIGCEALARFKDHIGEIYPDQFLPILKALNLTLPFTEKMLVSTLSNAEKMAFPNSFRFSFNFFPRDIIDAETMLLLFKLPNVAQSRFHLVLEIVEDEKLDNEDAHKNLELACQHGWTIAVDDFGTGYSNLSQLKQFEAELLKIDRSFVNDMKADNIRASLIPHIVDIAKKMDMDIVAEGVENSAQHRQLVALGVRFGQGWLYGKPMTLSTLITYL
jgi:sensor c-di-GMP phosphodiesterase-like protein